MGFSSLMPLSPISSIRFLISMERSATGFSRGSLIPSFDWIQILLADMTMACGMNVVDDAGGRLCWRTLLAEGRGWWRWFERWENLVGGKEAAEGSSLKQQTKGQLATFISESLMLFPVNSQRRVFILGSKKVCYFRDKVGLLAF